MLFFSSPKELLSTKRLPYWEFDVSEEANRDEFAIRLPRARLIPQIFFGGEYIGGDERLCIWDEKGRLDSLAG